MRAHFHNLQALRGVACLAVVAFHLWGWEVSFGIETPVFREVRRFGFAGVDVFFVLSGFLITATNRQQLGRPAAVPRYLFRRFWRIYPAYWVALAASAAFGWAAFGWPVASADWAAGWPAWLALVPADRPNPVIGQAWTLSFEVFFYLVFGVLMLVPPRWAAAALGLWAAAAVGRLAGPDSGNPLVTSAVSPFVLEFLGGCLVAWLAGRGVRGGWRAALVLGLGYAAAGEFVVTATAATPYLLEMASPRTRVGVFGPPAVLLVYGLVAAEGRWPRRVPGWLLRVGDASYSLYLLHFTVILAGVAVGMWFPHTRLTHALWVGGTFVAVLAVGLLAHTFVERPLLNLVRRRKPPRGATAATPPEPLRLAA